MSRGTVLILTIFLVLDAIVVGAIVLGVRNSVWGPIVRAYPAIDRTFGEDSGRIAWQVSIDIMNLGLCFRLATDDTYLHFTPALLGTVFRLMPASVPWSEVEVLKRGSMLVKMKIKNKTVRVPAKLVPSPPAPG